MLLLLLVYSTGWGDIIKDVQKNGKIEAIYFGSPQSKWLCIGRIPKKPNCYHPIPSYECILRISLIRYWLI